MLPFDPGLGKARRLQWSLLESVIEEWLPAAVEGCPESPREGWVVGADRGRGGCLRTVRPWIGPDQQ